MEHLITTLFTTRKPLPLHPEVAKEADAGQDDETSEAVVPLTNLSLSGERNGVQESRGPHAPSRC